MWSKGIKISKVHLESTDIHGWHALWSSVLWGKAKCGREKAEKRVECHGGKLRWMWCVCVCVHECMCAILDQCCGQQQMAMLVPPGGSHLLFSCVCVCVPLLYPIWAKCQSYSSYTVRHHIHLFKNVIQIVCHSHKYFSNALICQFQSSQKKLLCQICKRLKKQVNYTVCFHSVIGFH